MSNATEPLDETPRPKQINVRLSEAALHHLTTLKQYYGLRNTTALVTFLLGEAVHRISTAQPARPVALTSALVVEDEEEDEFNVDVRSLRNTKRQVEGN